MNKEPVFYNQIVDKGQLRKLVAWAFSNYGSARAAQMADSLKDLGFQFATRAGVSISVNDLQVPPSKRQLLEDAEAKIRETEERYSRGEITEVERFQKVIDTWNSTSETLKDEVVRNFRATDPLNSVYMMAFSGARGNISQVRQLVGMRGLMANPQGEIIDLPIKTNFREGLTVTEYIISSYGARKGLVDTALRTADSGYLTRRLVDVSQDVIIREIDCGTARGIKLRSMTNGDRILIHLKDRLLGRVLAADVLVNNEPVLHPQAQVKTPWEGTIYYPTDPQATTASNRDRPTAQRNIELVLRAGSQQHILSVPKGYTLLVGDGASVAAGQVVAAIAAVRNQDMCEDLANAIAASVEEVTVRSPLTCEASRSVCQHCYGWSLAHGKMVDIGEAVGIIAAQSIGEPGTQLTMRTFHTGGVFTGEVDRQVIAEFAGEVRYGEGLRTRTIRNRHGDEREQVEMAAELIIVPSQKGLSPQRIHLTAGSYITVSDRQTVTAGQLLAEISATVSRKSTERAVKDVTSDLSGEVIFADLVPEEKTDRQGNTTRTAQRGGLLWILSGEVYNLPPNAEAVVKNHDKVEAGDVLAETKLVSINGGTVRHTEGKREIDIITASVLLDQAVVTTESTGGGDQYIIQTTGNQRFLLKAAPGTKVQSGQVVAELIDDHYRTVTGGIVKYAGIEITKRNKAKQGYEVSKGGTLLWVAEECHEVNKDISLLQVEEGQFVEAGTEVVKDIYCQNSGIVEIVQKNDILREIVIKPGELHLVDEFPDPDQRPEGYLAYPGQEVVPGHPLTEIRYCEYIDTPEGTAILLRPVVEYTVPDQPSVPSQASVSTSGAIQIELRSVQRLAYKDGERVRSVHGVDLMRTQLVLEMSQAGNHDHVATTQLIADIELVPALDNPDVKQLQLVILESLVLRRDSESDPLSGTTHTRLLIKDGDRIAPNAVVARTEIQCHQSGEVRGIRAGTEAVRRILIMRDSDLIDVPISGQPLVKPGDLLVAGSKLTKETKTPQSGQVLKVEGDQVTLRLARPYRVSAGAILQLDQGDLVQRGDNLVLLVFERAKTGDIIQGLPRIEELLEARKPKEACILSRRPGEAQVVYQQEETSDVKVIEADGTISDYPISPGQNVIVTDSQKVAVAEPLTDGPANPHEILEIFFQVSKETHGMYESALIALQNVQRFLVNEVQSVYQSQGIDISDKHIELIVRQMTNKVRVEDGGDTALLPGELMELREIEQYNESMAITGGAPAQYTPVMLGITKASLNTDSFISAASFQETTRVLTEAAIEGKSDWLRGLKENVIIGRLIPAGTGYNAYDEPISPNLDAVEYGDTYSYVEPMLTDALTDDVIDMLDDRTARTLQSREVSIGMTANSPPIDGLDSDNFEDSFDEEDDYDSDDEDEYDEED